MSATATKSRQKIEYTLAKYQDHFINSDDRQIAIVGAKGSSKTWSGARFVMVQIAKQRSAQGLVMFNTLQQARDIFFQDIEPLLKELNWPYAFNQQTMVCRVFDTIIHFRSAEPDAVKKIESVAYHWGWADEASFYGNEALKIFVSRIRKGTAMIRITSMPDDPDAFIYKFLEDSDYKLYEISLKDNPDRAFADRYEKFLSSIYSGNELKRYLSGERVSLAGVGLFATESSQRRDDIRIDPNLDIMLSWDFNAEYRAVSAWQVIGKHETGNDIVGCVRSWQMKEATVYEDAILIANELKEHAGRVFLNGDASGEARTASATMSMWQTIKRVFIDILGYEKLRFVVPAANPNVKNTILCVNWALRNNLVLFARSEKNVFASLSACRADRYGEIDKTGDYRGDSGARSHEADTARYALWYYFNKVYPGRNRVYIA